MNGNVEQTWAVSHAPIGSVTLANMEDSVLVEEQKSDVDGLMDQHSRTICRV